MMIKVFELIPKNFNLSKKLNVLMLTIFLSGIIISSAVYYNILLGNAKNELNAQANALISTMDSVRKYNQDKVTPLLEKQSEEKFLLESIPAFAVVNVFDTLTSSYKDNYGDYRYKDAMINPTNLRDKAIDDEVKIIDRLSQQDNSAATGVNIMQGFLKIDGETKFYTARPIKISQNSCLECHISLEKAPKSLQVLYRQGTYQGNQGFGWELNKVIGAKIVYVPADKVYATANRNFILILGVFVAIFAVAILLANLWLKQYVVRPLNRMTKVAEAVSLGDMDANFEKQSNDEVGRLADAFTRMKTSLEIAIRRLTKRSDRSPDEPN
jgi:HAMP domain-containing protein